MDLDVTDIALRLLARYQSAQMAYTIAGINAGDYKRDSADWHFWWRTRQRIGELAHVSSNRANGPSAIREELSV